MFFTLTNIILDISFGILWWTTKNTTYLLYYGIRKLASNHTRIEYNINNSDNDEKIYFIVSENEYKRLNN
jgi:hypothetical protein